MTGDIESLFLSQLAVSDRTRRNYLNAIRSTFLRSILYEYCGTSNLFDIIDIKKIYEVYSVVNIHPRNINNHRNYSAPIMKYICFLNNGRKYGRKRDYQRKRNQK